MSTGFFTEAQMDRINLKTMATPLPGTYTGKELMALLVTRAKPQNKPNTTDLSVADTVEWYCRAKPHEVKAEFERLEPTTLYQQHFDILTVMHERPDDFRKAVEAVERGWRPENG